MSGANPDLPILDELGAEFATRVDAAFDAAPQRQRARLPQSPVRTRPRRRQARRVARRAVIVLVLLCLVGGVALAARFGGGTGEVPAHTSPTALGRDSAQGWQLSAYRDRGRLCVLFTLAGEPASQCGPEPHLDGLRTSSAIGAGKRFVVGVTGPRVDTIEVGVGGTSASATTRAPVDPEAAREAGVPAGTRWFVVSVDAPDASPIAAPANVLAFGDGRRLGPAYLDCSLGVVGAACERRIRARAAGSAR